MVVIIKDLAATCEYHIRQTFKCDAAAAVAVGPLADALGGSTNYIIIFIPIEINCILSK